MAPVDGGTEASKRMHEYLLSKQRKQEEFWLRKYGKVLQSTPSSVGKPGGNPRLPAAGGSTSGRSSNGGLSTESSAANAGGLLPPIPGAAQASAPGPAGALPHQHRQPKGHAPIFHAKEPVRDFFSRNVRQARAGAAAPTRDEYGNLQPASHLPPEPYRKGRPGHLPPLGGERSYAAGAQPPQSEYSAPQLGGEGSEAWQAAGSPNAGAYQTPQQAPANKQRPPWTGPVGGAFPGRLAPLSHEPSHVRSSHNTAPATSPYLNKPLRNLELELGVIKAVKAREDVLERLRVAGGKLDSGFGGAVPVVLSSVDPMVRLFYRLVSSLRQRTLDAVEAIAAWRRKVSPTEPFIYYGVDYLASIGPDASFLDELPFLRSRLSFGRAADDPFLAELTPDGVPIEEATTCDLRRGGQRFSSDALRIRMARKVLAQYCGRPLPHDVSSLTLPSVDSGAPSSQLFGEPSQPSGGLAVAEPQDRLASPPVAKSAVPVLPPLPRAITPPAVSSSAAAASDAKSVDVDTDVAAEAAATLADELEPLEPEEQEQRADDQAVGDQDMRLQEQEEQEQDQPPASAAAEPEAEPQAAAAEQPADTQPPQEPAQPEDLLAFETDEDFIDFALGAIIHSLEPPYLDGIEPGTFTVAGWEIDRQLEEVVRGIASPDRIARAGASRGRTASPQKPAPRMPPAREAAIASPAKPPSRGGRIPAPPASISKPPSGSGADDAAAAAKPPSRGFSRIPAPPLAAPVPQPEASAPGAGSSMDPVRSPVRVHLRPGSRGVGLDISMDGDATGLADPADVPPVGAYASQAEEGAATSPETRPPVRVHLRPGSRGVGLDISMDGEGLGEAGPAGGLPAISEDRSAYFGDPEEIGADVDTGADASVRSPVRVHLRPGSRTVNLGLSIDGESFDVQAPAASQDPQIAEDTPVPEPSENVRDGDVAGSRPPVRVHLRPGSQGVGVGLSMDGEAFEIGAASVPKLSLVAEPDVADAGSPSARLVPALEDSPSPLQGSLSARGNRASMRSARSGSRPGSAVAASREGLPMTFSKEYE